MDVKGAASNGVQGRSAGPFACLILAGGEGRRLGGVDKAFVALHERPMIEHVIQRLRGSAVAISAAGDVSRFDRYGLAVLGDGPHRGKGPLAGVLAGLVWAAALGSETLLTVPVDTLFVPSDLAARLGRAPSVAAWGLRVHHLVALWPITAIAALEAFLGGGEPYRVADFGRRIAQRVVVFDDELDPFVNVNTPDDLAAAEVRRC